MTTVDEVKQQANNLSNESLQCTRRILQTAVITQETGARTIETLDAQQMQLRHIDGVQHAVDNDLTKGEAHLKNMGLLCGCFPAFWRKQERSKTYAKLAKRDKIPTKTTIIHMEGHSVKGKFIVPVTNDAREDEMEQNLQQTDSIVQNLKEQAQIISLTLNEQNQLLSAMNEHATASNERLRLVDKRTTELLI